ncbi:MAG: uracil-DNA glycosylase family protein [Verrucomicrobiota bacterium]
MPDLITAADQLRQSLRGLSFPEPVSHTYNPLEYAWEPHTKYLSTYGEGRKKVLLLGMNPGPWGMAQTGIPFGEIEHVRDYLGIEAPVSKPDPEHPKRPIEGFACARSEVSGKRLWGLFKDKFPDPHDFFANHFVANYCPLVWMKDTGANLTPDKLPAASLTPVEKHCQTHLRTLIETLQPEHLIGVGAYAETKLQQAATELNYQAQLGRILHPSPASPAANRGWAEAATKQLTTLGIWPG